MADGVDKILYTDGYRIGARSDYNGVLLLDTILQSRVFRSEDVVKIELLLSEGALLYRCLRRTELPGVEHVQEVLQELSAKIVAAQANQKKGVKAQKVDGLFCDESVLKSLSGGMLTEVLIQVR